MQTRTQQIFYFYFFAVATVRGVNGRRIYGIADDDDKEQRRPYDNGLSGGIIVKK